MTQPRPPQARALSREKSRGAPGDPPDLSGVFARVTVGALRLSDAALRVHIVQLMWDFRYKRRPLTVDDLCALIGCSRRTAFRALAEIKRVSPVTPSAGPMECQI